MYFHLITWFDMIVLNLGYLCTEAVQELVGGIGKIPNYARFTPVPL